MKRPSFSKVVHRGIEIFLPLLQQERSEIQDLGPRGYKSRGWNAEQWNDFCTSVEYLEKMLVWRDEAMKERAKEPANGS